MSQDKDDIDHERHLVEVRVRNLLEEVTKQQTMISQASQALNLCNATIEFSGSAEQVEGERLLLLSSKCMNHNSSLELSPFLPIR